MVGSQALVAYLDAGVPVVKTYDVASYGSIKPSKLSFEVWDTAAELSGGQMMMFAKLKVPTAATTLNQVWQVGPSVDGTNLVVHEFQPANLNSKGTLALSGGEVTNNGGGEIDSRTMRKNVRSLRIICPVIFGMFLRFPSSETFGFFSAFNFSDSWSFERGELGVSVPHRNRDGEVP